MASSPPPPLLLLLLLSFLLLLPPSSAAAITPESCSPSDPPCSSLVAYLHPSNLLISVISLLFSVPPLTLLSYNEFDLSLNASQIVVPSNKLLRIPETCGCGALGQRVLTSVNYTVVHGDTLSTIAQSYYSQFVTYQEIATANIISNPNLILPGQMFTIPIPCACRNGTDQGHAAEFLSYVVQSEDTLSAIASDFNTTVTDLENINSLGSNVSLKAFTTLFVPIAVCKANFSAHAIDGNLTVPDGSSVFTANNCVQCSCSNGSLYCSPAPAAIGSSCSTITCKSSKLTLGASSTSAGTHGCKVESCVYKGYTSAGIIATLETEVDTTCPASPPPPLLYKPPNNIAASPLNSPVVTQGSSSPPPPSGTSPESPPPTGAPSSAGSHSSDASRGAAISAWPLALCISVGLLHPLTLAASLLLELLGSQHLRFRSGN